MVVRQLDVVSASSRTVAPCLCIQPGLFSEGEDPLDQDKANGAENFCLRYMAILWSAILQITFKEGRQV